MESIEPNARIADLVGLLYVLTYVFPDRTDLYELEKEMEVDLDDLMPIVYTAARLGFVHVVDGDIEITGLGKEYILGSIKRRKEILRQILDRLEPFATAISMGDFTVDDLYDALEAKGIQTYNSPSGRRDLEVILIEWGIYSGLIRKTEDGFEAVKKAVKS
ncbi:ABC transporter ATP-binding protein [Thermogymnomonas acidicola]|uniref:ABC transporter ATP-binding protein n=1 Tax=Thermogymnomonas acidicola TaxID=399579 RepID=A0AA37BR99_9ARCH|nr:AAA-associated domain-containing protein [Thermogymnomonas acidicola]GGM73255.1 ABC transporter ATP-binding protein [Thermogymnomonas acidicola]